MEVAVWSEGELVLGGTSAVIVLVKPRRGREQILISSSSLCLCFQPAGSNQGCPGPASEVRLLGQSKTTKVRDASGSEKPMEDKQLKKEEEARGIYGITGKKKRYKEAPMEGPGESGVEVWDSAALGTSSWLLCVSSDKLGSDYLELAEVIEFSQCDV